MAQEINGGGGLSTAQTALCTKAGQVALLCCTSHIVLIWQMRHSIH